MKIYLKGCSQGQSSTKHHTLKHVRGPICVKLIGSVRERWVAAVSGSGGAALRCGIIWWSNRRLMSSPWWPLRLPVSRRTLRHEASKLVKCRVQQSLTGLLSFIAIISYCTSDIQGHCYKQWTTMCTYSAALECCFHKGFCPNGTPKQKQPQMWHLSYCWLCGRWRRILRKREKEAEKKQKKRADCRDSSHVRKEVPEYAASVIICASDNHLCQIFIHIYICSKTDNC